jgi:hypothetical protein
MARSVVDPRQRKSANVKWMFSLVVFALRGKRTFISSLGSFDHCARPFCARCPAEKLENARTCERAWRIAQNTNVRPTPSPGAAKCDG